MRHFLFVGIVLGVGFAVGASTALAAAPPKPPEVPAKIDLSVSPAGVAPGEKTRVTVKLDPIEGVTINRYPKIKLKVAAQKGLVGESQASIGNDAPPPPEKLKTNYWDKVDPLELDLTLETSAPKGKHELEGKLTYYYCVKASGFCAPKRLTLEIPVEVR